MKLVLFNDCLHGMVQGAPVIDAMDALKGMTLRHRLKASVKAKS